MVLTVDRKMNALQKSLDETKQMRQTEGESVVTAEMFMEKIEYNNKQAELEDEESRIMDDLSDEQHDLLCFQSEAN